MEDKKVQEIAREITNGYSPKGLPSLEQISWAFPIEDRERVYFVRNHYMTRIPNTQEGGAMVQIMVYKNLDNVLRFLSEGRKLRGGGWPNHTCSVGDADDAAYIVFPYWPHAPEGLMSIKSPIEKQSGFFWDNIPSELVKAVLTTDKIIRRVGDVYADETATRDYLKNMRLASELGRSYLELVAQNRDSARDYPQLVQDTNIELWNLGDKFQWGFYSDGEPQLDQGTVLKNEEEKLQAEFVSFDEREQTLGTEDLPHSELKKFSGSLWRLVTPR